MDIGDGQVEDLGALSPLPTEVLLNVVNRSTLLDVLHLCQVCRSMRSVAAHQNSTLKSKLMALAFFYIDTKRPLKAIATLETTLELFPNSADVYKELGCSWMDVSKNRKAAEIFRRGVQVADSRAYGLILAAQMAWAEGDNERAWDLADEAVREDPRDARTYHFRAFMQSSLAAGPEDRKSQDVEINDYNYIIEHLPHYHRISIIHNNLGYVHYEMKDYERANKHFDLSMAMCPHHAQTYYNKAVCVADMGNMELAATYCDRMIQINPEHSDAFALRGWIHIGVGELTQGVIAYRHALESQLVIDAYTIIVYTGGLAGLGQFGDIYALLKHFIPRFTDEVLKLQEKVKKADTELFKKYQQSKLKIRQSCLAICHRIQGEVSLLHGEFGAVKHNYETFLRHLNDLPEQTQQKWATPLLKICSDLDLTTIGAETVQLILAYHRLRREIDGPEQAFRAFQKHLLTARFELNVAEQKYLVACVGHLLLSLYWEGEAQPSDLLEEFCVHWEVSDPGFVKLAARPHYLVNLFELSTRIGNGPALQMIIKAGNSDTEADRFLIQALGQLARLQDMFGAEDMDNGGEVDEGEEPGHDGEEFNGEEEEE